MPLVIDDAQALLTPKELLVLLGLKDGKTQGDIAREMYRARSTVKSHVQHIEQKLDARNATQAIARAVELGILRLLPCFLVAMVLLNCVFSGFDEAALRRPPRGVRVSRVVSRTRVERLGGAFG